MTGAGGYAPEAHYDHVTAAWQLLLGEELHYGVFEHGDEPLPVATAALTSLMITAADLRPGLDVLDVGCGTGTPACRLVADTGVRVLGITTSAVGVAAATERATLAGVGEHARFELRDGMRTGLPDACVDRVWVLESAHLMRDRDALVAECARVVRPGGRVVLCDLLRHRLIPFAEVRERRAEFVTLRNAFGDAHFESLDYYSRAAGEHGLTVVAADDLTAQTRPTFDRWRDNAAAHRDAVVAAIGAQGWADFVASCDILERCWDDRTFGYGLIAAVKPLP